MPKRKLEFVSLIEEELKRREEDRKRMGAEIAERMKHYDPVVKYRNDIEKQFQSDASMFVLEVPKSDRSHCKARFCLPSNLGGDSTIVSRYRLNLKDLTGQRTAERSY